MTSHQINPPFPQTPPATRFSNYTSPQIGHCAMPYQGTMPSPNMAPTLPSPNVATTLTSSNVAANVSSDVSSPGLTSSIVAPTVPINSALPAGISEDSPVPTSSMLSR